MKAIKQIIYIIGLAGILSGCTHQLEVRNMALYRNHPIARLNQFHVVGITSPSGDESSRKLVQATVTSLKTHSAAVVVYPYTASSSPRPGIVADISIDTEYKGSGANFWINWPGFLIFTPAWNGYVYKANYDVDITLRRGSDRAQLDRWKMPIKLDLRQAAMNRTWTEIGWLEVGIIPLVAGPFFIQYDPKVTPILMDEIEVPIGDYIAAEIVKRINSAKVSAAARAVDENASTGGTQSFESRWNRLIQLRDNGSITKAEFTRQLDELMNQRTPAQ